MLAESPSGAPSVELALGAGVRSRIGGAGFERGRLRHRFEGLREHLLRRCEHRGQRARMNVA